MSKEREEYRKRVEDRITVDETGSSYVSFMPQCNLCKNSSKGTDCKEFGKIPSNYRNDEEECPKRIV